MRKHNVSSRVLGEKGAALARGKKSPSSSSEHRKGSSSSNEHEHVSEHVCDYV
jgi:hypothetical protein